MSYPDKSELRKVGWGSLGVEARKGEWWLQGDQPRICQHKGYASVCHGTGVGHHKTSSRARARSLDGRTNSAAQRTWSYHQILKGWKTRISFALPKEPKMSNSLMMGLIKEPKRMPTRISFKHLPTAHSMTINTRAQSGNVSGGSQLVIHKGRRQRESDIIKYNQLGAWACLLCQKSQLHTLPRKPPFCSPQNTGRRDRTMKRNLSTCTREVRMAQGEVLDHSLGKYHTRLVGRWVQRSLESLGNWLVILKKVVLVFYKPEIL